MGYKNLSNFQVILDQEDFNYISDHNKIKEIVEIILYRISEPDDTESAHIKLIEEFLNNLTSFYNSIGGHNIPDIERANLIVQEDLQRCVKLFSEPGFKRRSISRGYCKKFNKTFLYGLSKLLDGIRLAFHPNLVSSTAINMDQYIRYILNNVEGLGQFYDFNSSGTNSFKKQINNFSFANIISISRHLHPNTKAGPERPNWRGSGWDKYGEGRGDAFRMYGTPKKLFRRKRIYYLIPNTLPLKRRMDAFVLSNTPSSCHFS